MSFPISITTACTPWVPIAELAPIAAAAGVQGLDLACKVHRADPAQPAGFWGNNHAVLADDEHLPQRAAAAASVLATNGLTCPILTGYADCRDMAAVKRMIATAHTLGARMVRLWVPDGRPGQFRTHFADLQRCWRELSALGRGEGLRFVIELHDGTPVTGAHAACRMLDGLDPATVGIIADFANTIREGVEPLFPAIEHLGPYLAWVHVKDITILPDKASWNGLKSEFRPLGSGQVSWVQIIRALRSSGYAGGLTLENFTRLEAGPKRIAEDVSWLRTVIAAALDPA